MYTSLTWTAADSISSMQVFQCRKELAGPPSTLEIYMCSQTVPPPQLLRAKWSDQQRAASSQGLAPVPAGQGAEGRTPLK